MNQPSEITPQQLVEMLSFAKMIIGIMIAGFIFAAGLIIWAIRLEGQVKQSKIKLAEHDEEIKKSRDNNVTIGRLLEKIEGLETLIEVKIEAFAQQLTELSERMSGRPAKRKR